MTWSLLVGPQTQTSHINEKKNFGQKSIFSSKKLMLEKLAKIAAGILVIVI